MRHLPLLFFYVWLVLVLGAVYVDLSPDKPATSYVDAVRGASLGGSQYGEGTQAPRPAVSNARTGRSFSLRFTVDLRPWPFLDRHMYAADGQHQLLNVTKEAQEALAQNGACLEVTSRNLPSLLRAAQLESTQP